MTGSYDLPAPREQVWEALNDPDVLKQCIPGCESIEKKSDTEFAAVATAKVGPVKSRFKGNVTLSDLDPPNGYLISGEGSGGAAGFAKGGARVTLEDLGSGRTRLAYDVDATVGGKLAQIGQRLVDSTAKKMADQFFSRFAEVVGGPAEPEAPPAETEAPPAEVEAPPAEVEAPPAEAEAPPAEAEAAPAREPTGMEVLGANQARVRQLSYLGVAVAVLLIVYLLFGSY